ncbi:hypothetical protein [Emticicia agri]|uniref:hypothetical protein n=1 Tax=Emticicia agri TaxID=2492393 RepID=UPI0013EDCB18|nr:hypothetical protein [Emticicia agri]
MLSVCLEKLTYAITIRRLMVAVHFFRNNKKSSSYPLMQSGLTDNRVSTKGRIVVLK